MFQGHEACSQLNYLSGLFILFWPRISIRQQSFHVVHMRDYITNFKISLSLLKRNTPHAHHLYISQIQRLKSPPCAMLPR